MGSIQEANSLPIEMASESRDIEMRDSEGEEGPSNATGILSHTNGLSDAHDPSKTNQHVIKGHLTLYKKDENEANHSPSSNHFHDSSIPLPSVEKDDDAGSPSTAAEPEEKTSRSEGRQKDNIPSSSPTQPRHQSNSAPTSESIKLDKEIARLNEVLSETSAQAAQKVLHDKWRYFLFDQYDRSHISFILRAGFKNSSVHVVDKVLRDSTIFKDQFLDVASKKPGVIEKVISNATLSQLNHLPQRILDKALAERLKTVSAKLLIKWLAEADRLGYKLDDIIDEDDESVIPNHDTDTPGEVFEVEQPPPHPVPSYRDPLLTEQEMNIAAQRTAALKADAVRQQQQQELQQQQQQQKPPPPSQSRPTIANLDISRLKCPACDARFTSMSGYNYHITKKPCQKQAPISGSKWWCMNCIQAFTTKQGMDYHKLRKVCFGDDIAPATSPSSQLHQEAQSRSQPPPVTQPYPGPILPPPRPSFAQPPRAQSAQAQYTSAYSQPQPRPPIAVQRPPLHTPAPPAKPAPTPSMSTPVPENLSIPTDFRHSPSELSPEKLAALESELQEAEDRYQQQIAEIPTSYTEAERAHRLTSLKNANASRKSQIRKAHGVSLRLREKDKVARKAAGITPPGRPHLESGSPQPATTARPTSTPPTSSFSPVNVPPSRHSPSEYGRSGGPPHPSAVSHYNGPYGNPPHPSTGSQYKQPPQNARIRVQNPFSEPHPNTLTHALESVTPASGFGILRVSHPQPLTPTNYLKSNNTNKRRRSPEDDGSPNPPRTTAGPSYFAPNLFDQHSAKSPTQPNTPALSMMQVRAEDAASKLARKTPLAEGQTQLSPSTANQRDTPMTETPPTSTQSPSAAATNTKETAITIFSSSESESEPQPVAAAPKFHPATRVIEKDKDKERKKEQEKSGDSTEDEAEVGEEERRQKEREERKRNGEGTSGGVRRGFMAKRGGHH
jgi:hypothetical protein